jgi:hypothetical protein
MTVRAANDTFFDLGLENVKRGTFADKSAYVAHLDAPNMIELHDDRIHQSTIDAGVC